MTKFLNISTDNTLGGSSSADDVVSSQKAIKYYVDGQASNYATAAQGALADTALQPNDNISELNNNAGYITGITSSDVTTALGYTPYDSSNPNGYTSNVGTVTSVNNTSPDGNGNVSLTIPTVNNSTITITQGGVTKGSFTLNQSSGDTIALDAGSGVNIDDKSITENTSNEIQTVGVIDQNNASNAIKTWTGTKAQYDDIVTKDANTLYNVTDDTDIGLNLLQAIYPVGSIYIGTMATCPLSLLFGTWTLVSSGRVLQGADANHSAGTSISAGLPNISGLFGSVNSAGTNDGPFSVTATGINCQGYWGGANASYGRQLKMDLSSANSIYGNSNTVQPPAYVVNIWERTA